MEREREATFVVERRTVEIEVEVESDQDPNHAKRVEAFWMHALSIYLSAWGERACRAVKPYALVASAPRAVSA
jgi:hypothetical protein